MSASLIKPKVFSGLDATSSQARIIHAPVSCYDETLLQVSAAGEVIRCWCYASRPGESCSKGGVAELLSGHFAYESQWTLCLIKFSRSLYACRFSRTPRQASTSCSGFPLGSWLTLTPGANKVLYLSGVDRTHDKQVLVVTLSTNLRPKTTVLQLECKHTVSRGARLNLSLCASVALT